MVGEDDRQIFVTCVIGLVVSHIWHTLGQLYGFYDLLAVPKAHLGCAPYCNDLRSYFGGEGGSGGGGGGGP
jgi:hypothetical protein